MRLFRRAKAQIADGKQRVAIIGLDCAEPSLVFERFAGQLPTLNALMRRGVYGLLESVTPAITVPAWSCMMSGRDPGALGIYGFRNRSRYDYGALAVANGDAVHEPRLWDILSQYGKQSVVLNVPGTYPPKPLNGQLVSCFLTPNSQAAYTYPVTLKNDIQGWVGEYPFDVKEFRTEDKAKLLSDVYTMTRAHFAVARRLAATSWDLFVTVEIGVDRIHHALWRYLDPEHSHYKTNSPYANAILDYYQFVDREIAALLEIIGDAHLFIVSDHGAKRMEGGICLNEWLIREGYLVLRTPPNTNNGVVRFEALDVDWSRTRAWGEGGYYGRLFLNIAGREPQGIVPSEDADTLLNAITAKLEALGDEEGNPIGTRCFKPHDLYPEVNGLPPDLLIYFGDLGWRSIGTVGWNRLHIHENDGGPDDANHAQHGLFIYADPHRNLGGKEVAGAHLLQVAPTVLNLFGIPAGEKMRVPLAFAK